MKTLSLGDTGASVELLQLALARAGFAYSPIDGIFGRQTEAALTDFQKTRSLLPDGIAGKETQAALMPWYTGYLVHTVVDLNCQINRLGHTRQLTFHLHARRPRPLLTHDQILDVSRMRHGGDCGEHSGQQGFLCVFHFVIPLILEIEFISTPLRIRGCTPARPPRLPNPATTPQPTNSRVRPPPKRTNPARHQVRRERPWQTRPAQIWNSFRTEPE